MKISAPSFKGNWILHPTKQNCKFISIDNNPNERDIQEAINATETEKAHSGLNGRAYFLGKDLVVKKYMTRQEASNYQPDAEIDALELMLKKGYRHPNIQQGKYAFKTSNNEIFLVSSRIQGQKPDINNNQFNSENLNSLVNTISEIDTPRRKKEGCYFPYEVPMHYDLAPGNLVITKTNGGIIDFEYLKFEDLNERLIKQLKGETETFADFSDIPGIPSNLRTFEYRTLHGYLMNIENSSEANELFKEYLYAKSSYHKQRANFFNEEAKKVEKDNEDKLKDVCLNLAWKEEAHSDVLSKWRIDDNIVKSEAIKIQLANFIYTQGQFSNSGREKVNINQIKEYVKNAEKFFENRLKKSNSIEKRTYYRDCVNLINNWKGVIGWMDWQQECINNEDEKHIAELFQSKLTDKKQKTLDEHIVKI